MKNVKVEVSNIQWDTDDLSGLPETMIIEVPADEFTFQDKSDYDDIAGEYASNEISDQVGFCHTGFDLQILS
jgi:hypothetical protein